MARWVWIAMMVGTAVEFALGIACVVLLPLRRPDQWLPSQSRSVYAVHAVLGAALAISALVVVAAVLGESRLVRLGALVGLAGLGLGAAGGMLSVLHSWRLAGMGLMFAGALVAFFGYVVPLAAVPANEPPG